MDAFENLADRLAAPPLLYSLALLALLVVAGRWRTLRSRAGGLVLAALALAFLGAGLQDEGFRRLLLAPERLPVTVFAVTSFCLLWLAVRRAPEGDPGPWRGPSPAEAAAVAIAGLLLMALALKLEPPLTGPAVPPQPVKVPWFLAGLQEMRFYFDPWVSSYLVPGLLIATLLALPTLDPGPASPEPAGPRSASGGLATRRPGDPAARRPATVAFLLGWLLLATLPILVATYLRGPHWNAFGPFETWDATRPAPSPGQPLSALFWCRWLGRDVPPDFWLARELPGLLLLASYLLVLPWALQRWRATRGIFERYHRAVGARRYYLALILTLALGLVPLKMYGRWILGVGYWLHLPELPLNF